MSGPKRAVVIGGSLGGLFIGNLLHRAGWEVHIYERVAAQLESRGAGIVTHPELLDALVEAGVPVDDSIGVQVRERVTLEKDGSLIATRVQPQILTAWSRLFQGLKEAFPSRNYHYGKQLVDFTQDELSVTAKFLDGEQASGDILIAADGIRSAVRRQLLPHVKIEYAGYVAWRGLVDESVLSEAALRDIFPYFAFGLPPHEQMIAYPIAGKNNAVDPGQRRYNFVWYRPARDDVLLDMLTDSEGKVWHDGIPPPLIRSEVLAHARLCAHETLAPQFAELIDKADSIFFQPIVDLRSPQLALGRVALLGDAAFVARPHCGMGVAKAAGDAIALAKALNAHGEETAALEFYATGRLSFGDRVVSHARDLGAYMQAQASTAKEREMAERYRSPEAMMRDTAMPL